MVLHALIKIRDEIDSTPPFLRSCREGVCVMNGKCNTIEPECSGVALMSVTPGIGELSTRCAV